ncbi:MAG: RNA-binding protein [Labilithrix sp.]|nr:RNA-binding protein [Labilithrix sp.]
MSNRLYVGNLSYEATKDALHACFAECGDVAETHIVTDRETGRARGFAFITMRTDADADSAISRLNGAMFEGRPLRVNRAEERPARGGAGNARGGHRGW